MVCRNRSIVQRRKSNLSKKHAASSFILFLASFIEEEHFLKMFQIVSFNHLSIYHASTKIYNIKITRSRRERRYFLRLYHSIIHPFLAFIYQQEKYNVTLLIKSRKKWIIVRRISYSFPTTWMFSAASLSDPRVWLLSTRANLFSPESIGKQFCVHSFY